MPPTADQPPVLLPTAHRLAEDTHGVLRPSFTLQPRSVVALNRGDVIVDAVLGEVRVVFVAEFGYGEVHGERTYQVHWVSDDGLSTAARLFPASATLAVRTPARGDIRTIRRGIHVAARDGREIDPYTARLIAAHLQRGPGSALYAFAVSMAVTDRLYEELDEVRLSGRTDLDRWIDALANHCLNRTDHRRGVQRAPGRLPCGRRR